MTHVWMRFKVALVPAFFLLAFVAGPLLKAQDAAPLTLPAGSRIEVALVRPLMAATTAPGSPVYAQTTFPAK